MVLFPLWLIISAGTTDHINCIVYCVNVNMLSHTDASRSEVWWFALWRRQLWCQYNEKWWVLFSNNVINCVILLRLSLMKCFVSFSVLCQTMILADILFHLLARCECRNAKLPGTVSEISKFCLRLLCTLTCGKITCFCFFHLLLVVLFLSQRICG